MSTIATPVPSPTPANIASVVASLTAMQSLNDYIHSYGKDRFTRAYTTFSAEDDSDPGLEIGLNVVEGAFWAIGSEFGPAGNFAASFFSGILSAWASNAPGTPSSLTSGITSFEILFEQTCLAMHELLANYIATPQTYWNTAFTFNNASYVVGSLADPLNVFPAVNSATYNAMGTAALAGLDKSIWTFLLKAKYAIYCWSPNGSAPGTDQNQPPIAWMQAKYASYPARYYTYSWDAGNRCKDPSWTMIEYTLGTQPDEFSDCTIPDVIAQRFFIDSTPGVTINANGYYTREDVFTNLGLTVNTYFYQRPIVPTAPAPGAPAHSLSYLRAVKEGKTLTQMIEAEGREPVQSRVITKAQQDPSFAYELERRPRPTIEKFLGVKIDEAASITVVVETVSSFGVVVPKVK